MSNQITEGPQERPGLTDVELADWISSFGKRIQDLESDRDRLAQENARLSDENKLFRNKLKESEETNFTLVTEENTVIAMLRESLHEIHAETSESKVKILVESALANAESPVPTHDKGCSEFPCDCSLAMSDAAPQAKEQQILTILTEALNELRIARDALQRADKAGKGEA